MFGLELPKPPPAAIKAMLTPTPNVANMAVKIITRRMAAARRFLETILIQRSWLFKIDYFTISFQIRQLPHTRQFGCISLGNDYLSQLSGRSALLQYTLVAHFLSALSDIP